MSLFERIIARPRSLWLTIIISLLILTTPLAIIALDGMWEAIFSLGNWRPLFMAPAVIVYILLVSQRMAKGDSDLVKAFRPLLLIDDETFEQLAHKVKHISKVGETVALFIGVLLGLGISLTWLTWTTTFWLRIYVPVSLGLMWGILCWLIYYSFASTKLVTALHRQPLKVDILDTKPFEPVGRNSLVASLVFIGGIALGMFFSLDVKNILAWESWAINVPLLCVPVIVFFLNMRHTHRLLAAEKKRELGVVGQKILRLSALLRRRLAQEESLGEIAGEYSALIAYEARLRAASTWPYNTAMLRTLFFTILVPLLVRGASALLFGQ
jgi:hypothetical protein